MRRQSSKAALLSLAIDSQRPRDHKRDVELTPNRAWHGLGLEPRTGALLGLEPPSSEPAAARCAARNPLGTSSAPARNIERARNQGLRLDPSPRTVVARVSSSASRRVQSGNSRVSVRIGGGGASALEAGVGSERNGEPEALARAGLAPSTPLPPGRGPGPAFA